MHTTWQISSSEKDPVAVELTADVWYDVCCADQALDLWHMQNTVYTDIPVLDIWDWNMTVHYMKASEKEIMDKIFYGTRIE